MLRVLVLVNRKVLKEAQKAPCLRFFFFFFLVVVRRRRGRVGGRVVREKHKTYGVSSFASV